jgi:hypothetical protein
MAAIGKLSAVEVSKAKGPAVLHDGADFTSAFPPLARKPGCSGSNSTVSAKTWGLVPIPIFRLRRRVGAPENTETSAATGVDPLEAKAAQRQAHRIAVAKGRTFRECAAEFIEKNRPGWRNAKHRQAMGKHARHLRIPDSGGITRIGDRYRAGSAGA